MIASAAAGVLAGAAVGALGGIVSDSTRAVSGTIIGFAAMCTGIVGLVSLSPNPLQCNRETPRKWVRKGPVAWPLLNGVALGFGATTRIGFWLWYVVPAGSFLVADPRIGAAIWGTYGLTRASSAGVIWRMQAVRTDWTYLHLLRYRAAANQVTTVMLCIVGFTTFALMGL